MQGATTPQPMLRGMLTIPHQRRPLTSAEKRMGQRMLSSIRDAPQFSVAVDVNMDAMLRLKASVEPKISLTPLVLRAIADTLPAYPLLNAMLDGDSVVAFDRINLGVAMDTPHGLRVAVVRDAGPLSPHDIADRLRELSQRAQDDRLTLADLSQGTITVSNLGMFGVAQFTPIVNLPQTAIIGVASIRPQLELADGGRVVRASVMCVSMTCDHRVVDGATAARFLASLKTRMEAAA